MNINLPKASVGLGTSGIGDNFARARLLMAQKAGYVQSTPSPYSQPGTALKQYQSAAPMLNAVAQAQGQKGIPGLIRQGMMGRPQGQPVRGGATTLVNAPAPEFASQMASHAVGNPFASLGQPQMPIAPFNQKPPHEAPENIAGNPTNGGSMQPGQGGYVAPGPYRPGKPGPLGQPVITRPGRPEGGIVGPVPPGQPMPPWTGPYPPGTIANHSGGVDPRVNLLAMLLGAR